MILAPFRIDLRRVTPARLALAVFLGLIGAAITEWLALRWGWWAYSPAMPRVPGTDLGASPLAQFVVLPLGVLFWILPRLWKHDLRDGERHR